MIASPVKPAAHILPQPYPFPPCELVPRPGNGNTGIVPPWLVTPDRETER